MRITEYKIRNDKLGSMELAFASDLHDCDNEPIISVLKDKKLDAILIPGDFIHDDKIYERGIDFLCRASECAPTFCSLGNHEMRFKGDLAALIKTTGAILLDNDSCMFSNINIGGLSSGYKFNEKQSRTDITPQPDIEWLKKYSAQKGYKILMSHHPEYYDTYIKDLNIDLILSGHAHGGQWQFFGKGVFAPGQGMFPKYTYGMHDERFIVSRGLGNHYPIPRINNPAELIIIKINKD